jgi:hypothetical protein
MNTIENKIALENDSFLFKKQDFLFMIISIFIAGFIVKLPAFFTWNEEFFYTRNLSFIVFPLIMIFFWLKKKVSLRSLIIPTLILISSAVYINLLPGDNESDTLILTCIHLPILIWSLVGFAFTGNKPTELSGRVAFLRFNGDLIVMSSLLALAGILFTVITIGLYRLIGTDISDFYVNYIVAWGLPAIPILATILVTNYPGLVERVSPIIAKIFTPVVGLSLAIFLVTVIGAGKDPYNDRQFLLVFNALLIGVMAIILFSISEMSKGKINRIHIILLAVLAILTVVDNSMALSAILFRVGKFGITPNRLAVLGSNLIMLINLIAITYGLVNVIRNKSSIEKIELVMARFLPLYPIWAAFIVFVTPLLFGFK